MRTLVLLICLALSAFLGEARMNNSDNQPDLLAVKHARILFGHQSVGENILQGIQEIAVNSGQEAPKRVRLPKEKAGSEAFLADSRIGTNGDPGSKCADFLKVVRMFPRDGLDVVVMKFCYDDVTAQTDVRAVLNMYHRVVDSIRAADSHLVVVHCTVPLTVRTSPWKRFVKWILRRDESSDVDNARRSEYNALLRGEYHNEPIFDIAAYESTQPDGTRNSFAIDGKESYSLAGQYSEDGGHLNLLGRKVLATEFLRVLAEALAIRNHATNHM